MGKTKESLLSYYQLLLTDHGQEAWYTELENTKDKTNEEMLNHVKCIAIRKESLNVSHNYSYSCLASIMAIAIVIRHPFFSMYPETKYKLRPLFHQKLEPFHGNCEFEIIWVWIKKKVLCLALVTLYLLLVNKNKL